MRYIYALSILWLLCTVESASAQASSGQAIAGAGGVSCGKYLEIRAHSSAELDGLFTSWLQGFLSGMNTYRFVATRQEMSQIPDGPSLLAYMDKYCRDNPLKSAYSGAMTLHSGL